MRFQYHKPTPNLYQKNNPKKPLTTINNAQLEKLNKLAEKYRCCGISYAKLSDEFRKKWSIDYDNVIIFKFLMADGFLEYKPSTDKARALDREFQEIGVNVFQLADYLRDEGFMANLINPIDDKINLRELVMQSNDCGILRNNMCLFKEGLNICFFPIYTSIENLPYRKENDMEWISKYCESCGKCIRRCPNNAFDDNEKVLGKVCTAHSEGCSICLLVCPFYKKGYDRIKKEYQKKRRIKNKK